MGLTSDEEDDGLEDLRQQAQNHGSCLLLMPGCPPSFFAAATGCYVAARTASGLRGPQIASAAVCSVLNARLSATRSARAHRFYRLPGLCAKLPGLL